MQNKTRKSIDPFFETNYTATTFDTINQLYQKTHFYCIICKKNLVDKKIDVQDYSEPRFVILRKSYCIHCWLPMVTLEG
jgi:hypothetical protein